MDGNMGLGLITGKLQNNYRCQHVPWTNYRKIQNNYKYMVKLCRIYEFSKENTTLGLRSWSWGQKWRPRLGRGVELGPGSPPFLTPGPASEVQCCISLQQFIYCTTYYNIFVIILCVFCNLSKVHAGICNYFVIFL